MTKENYYSIKSLIKENRHLDIKKLFEILPSELKEPALMNRFDILGFDIQSVGKYPIKVYWKKIDKTDVYKKDYYEVLKDV